MLIIILALLLLLSVLLFYHTRYNNKNIIEGIDNINTVNNALSDNPVFLGLKTSTNINSIASRVKNFDNIKKRTLQSQADISSLTEQINNLKLLEKQTLQNTDSVSALTNQINNLSSLKQDITDLSSQISTNVKLMANVGKHIQTVGYGAITPNSNPDPPPKGTGSIWPP
jgi:DNA repair exonuclease SbcCD ATPase subunit